MLRAAGEKHQIHDSLTLAEDHPAIKQQSWLPLMTHASFSNLVRAD